MFGLQTILLSFYIFVIGYFIGYIGFIYQVVIGFVIEIEIGIYLFVIVYVFGYYLGCGFTD